MVDPPEWTGMGLRQGITEDPNSYDNTVGKDSAHFITRRSWVSLSGGQCTDPIDETRKAGGQLNHTLVTRT